jgi:hypothetical protein
MLNDKCFLICHHGQLGTPILQEKKKVGNVKKERKGEERRGEREREEKQRRKKVIIIKKKGVKNEKKVIDLK